LSETKNLHPFTESSYPKRSSMSNRQPSTEPPMTSRIQLHNPTEVEIKNSQQNSNSLIKSTNKTKTIPSNLSLYSQNRTSKNSTKSRIISLYAQRKTCYKCTMCECAFMEKQNLTEHLKRMHNNTTQPKGHQIPIHAALGLCSICGGHSYSLSGVECPRRENLCVTCISKNLTVINNCDEYQIKCPSGDTEHNLQYHEGVFIEVLVGQLPDDILIDYVANTGT